MTPALFHLPKRYGESKIPACPICSKSGTVRNPQGIPVCEAHRSSIVNTRVSIFTEFAVGKVVARKWL